LILEQQASLLIVRNNQGMHNVSLFKAISLFWLFWQDPFLHFPKCSFTPFSSKQFLDAAFSQNRLSFTLCSSFSPTTVPTRQARDQT
jgi:hypothetical protein